MSFTCLPLFLYLYFLVFSIYFPQYPKLLSPTGTLLPSPRPPFPFQSATLQDPNQMLLPKALLGPGFAESSLLFLLSSTVFHARLQRHLQFVLYYSYVSMCCFYIVRSNLSLQYLAQCINQLRAENNSR